MWPAEVGWDGDGDRSSPASGPSAFLNSPQPLVCIRRVMRGNEVGVGVGVCVGWTALHCATLQQPIHIHPMGNPDETNSKQRDETKEGEREKERRREKGIEWLR